MTVVEPNQNNKRQTCEHNDSKVNEPSYHLREQIHREEEHAFQYFPTASGGVPKPAMRIIQKAGGLGAFSQVPLGSRRPAQGSTKTSQHENMN